MAALQATNASALDGHTLHAAFGMTPFASGSESSKKRGSDGAKKVEAARRIQQWRWLITDEISMVSASFLAELDAHLRSVMSAARQGKVDAEGVDRPGEYVVLW